MSRINKKLETWTSKGLISQAQFNSIISYESSLPKTNWTMLGVIILAVGTISLGIISLIAYNWYLIPNVVKLSTGFTILFATAGFILRSGQRYSLIVKDGLIVFFIVFCFAMIGLIAQIYNLKGDEYQTGLLWSAMTIVLVSTASHFLIPYFWSGIFTLSLMSGCWSWPPLKDSIGAHTLFFMFLIAFLVALTQLLFRRTALITALQKSVIFFWILGAVFGSIGGLGVHTAQGSINKVLPHFGLGAFTILILCCDRSVKRIYKLMGTLLVVLLSLSTWLVISDPNMHTLQSVIGILCFAAWAVVFFAANQRRMYHIMFILIAVKVFEIFVREADSLIATGVGLIAAGSIVMLAAYGWNRKKDILERRLLEFIK